MLPVIRKSLRNQLMLAMMATTMVALLVTAVILVVYDYRNYKAAWVSDLDTQAGILARASAPALEFGDPAAARKYLSYLNARPRILAAAIYTSRGTLFAAYTRPGVTSPAWPRPPVRDGYRVDKGQLILVKRIVGTDKVLGAVYLLARYELPDRLWRYIAIVGAVMGLSLLVGLLASYRMQHSVAQPILQISDVAHRVRERRDFSLRVEKTTEGEIGYLVDAFNEMLAEIERRARALEARQRGPGA